MINVLTSKDIARVNRSIESIMRKIEASLERTAPLHKKHEEEFEISCYQHGLIYFP